MILELIGVSDARGQIRREQDGEGNGGGEEASGDAWGVFGAGNGNDETSVGGRRGAVGDGVDIDGVGWAAPGLNLLSYFLGVGWGKNAGGVGVPKGVWKRDTASERPMGASTRGPSKG